MTIKIIRGSKAEYFAYRYGKSNAGELRDVYANYSLSKERSFENIKHATRLNGYYDLRIVSANSFQYTVGYRDAKTLYIETRNTIYCIPIETLTIKHFVEGDF